jgi:chromosomal replication initiator protein
VLKRLYHEKIQEYLGAITQSNFKCSIMDEEALATRLPVIEKLSTEKKFFSNLNPRYSFDNFVSGFCNLESYQASLATAMDPGGFYNPLFIYGKSGLGKTHLLHAIGNYIRIKKDASMKVLYLTADDFFEEYVKSIKDKETESLKDRFREVDVLLLDDVQFLSTKEKTKEIFFHIFNLLINAGKQIVITSDRPPSELRSLEDRLVSRFASGLTVEIKNLDYETALKILKKKIEIQDINGGKIDEKVLEYIAQNYLGDVRQLEGALNKLLFYAITYNRKEEIDLPMALETFKSFSAIKENNSINAEKIKMVVSEYYNISPNQLISKLRTSNLVVARHIAIYLCRTMLDISLQSIGQAFGGRDHSTIISACEKVENLLKTDQDYIIVIENLKKLIK